MTRDKPFFPDLIKLGFGKKNIITITYIFISKCFMWNGFICVIVYNMQTILGISYEAMLPHIYFTSC